MSLVKVVLSLLSVITAYLIIFLLRGFWIFDRMGNPGHFFDVPAFNIFDLLIVCVILLSFFSMVVFFRKFFLWFFKILTRRFEKDEC